MKVYVCITNQSVVFVSPSLCDVPFKLPSTPAPELEPASLPTFTQISYENGVLQNTVTSRTRERLGDEIGTDG